MSENTIEGLKLLIDEWFKQIDKHLEKMDSRLKTMEEFLRDNGKPGINVRINRLEKFRNLLWAVFVIVLAGFVSCLRPKNRFEDPPSP